MATKVSTTWEVGKVTSCGKWLGGSSSSREGEGGATTHTLLTGRGRRLDDSGERGARLARCASMMRLLLRLLTPRRLRRLLHLHLVRLKLTLLLGQLRNLRFQLLDLRLQLTGENPKNGSWIWTFQPLSHLSKWEVFPHSSSFYINSFTNTIHQQKNGVNRMWPNSNYRKLFWILKST